MSFSLSTLTDGVENFYWLHQIEPADRAAVGDLAFDLGELIKRGHPVLPGFVVSAKIYSEFLKTIDWQEPILVDFATSSLHIEVLDPRQLQAIAQRIRHQIITSRLSSEFRSTLQSALDSLKAEAVMFRLSLKFPPMSVDGLFDPVMSWTKIDAVELGIKQAWAELFRARNLLYWQRKNVKLEHLQPIVIVQQLSNAIASGSVRIGPESWEIQAAWGLELAALWGQTQPDSYQVDPQTGEVLGQRLGYKTLAYNLKSSAGDLNAPEGKWKGFAQCSLSPRQSPAEAKFLSSEQYQEPVLKPAQLRSLIELVRPIVGYLETSGSIEWTLCESCQFYISQVCIFENFPRPKENPAADWEESAADLQGIGASAGQTAGKAYIFGTPPGVDTSGFPPGAILVVAAMTPELLPLLKGAGGLVAERGGMTGHGAILARELGIPAVIGVPNATGRIKMGESLLVDGSRGEVYRISDPNMAIKGQSSPAEANGMFSENRLQVPLATRLMVNVSQSGSWGRLKNLPIDGVGLVRSELMALDALEWENVPVDFSRWLHPQNHSVFIEGMAGNLERLAKEIAPRPLFYRALDLREFHREARPLWNGENSELAALSRSVHCDNHCQGEYSTLFELELAVLSKLHQSGCDNIRLILPFVRSVEEFCVYHRHIEQAGLTCHPHFRVWIMAEVPSVIFLLSEYIKAGVQGIAIGTNDLTQFLLGIDRNQTDHPSHLNELNPAMLKAVQQLVTQARAAEIPCSVCGDAPALYPELIDYLVRWGVTSISVNPDAVEKTYLAIARAEHSLILEHSRSFVQSNQNPG